MITFNQVYKCYPQGQHALVDLNFTLKQGGISFITGHSGAGKSTVLKLIAALESPTSGIITINNHNINKMQHSQIANLRRQIGLIFQTPNFLPDHTIHENIALPLQIAGFRSNEIKKHVRTTLNKVNLLDKEFLFPDMLSCGEKQRAGIARAIITNPAIILADEPTGNLDPTLANEIMQLFMDFNYSGSTVLIASHNIDLINKFNCRTLTLKNGALINDAG